MSGQFSNSMMMSALLAEYSLLNAIAMDGLTDYEQITLTTSSTHSGSVWLCKTKNGIVQPIFDNQVYFNALDQLVVNGLTSTAVYKDLTGLFLHVYWNTSGAWVNGVAVTGTGTYATASIINPRLGFDGANYWPGLFTEFGFFNGTSEALTGGRLDTATPNWKAAAVAGTPHTRLLFENGIGLGDNSGSGGAWTVNGTPAQVTSTPTDPAATINPLALWNGKSYGAGVISNNNQTFSDSGGWGTEMYSTILMKTGKWYWEVDFSTLWTGSGVMGVRQYKDTHNENGDYIGERTYQPNGDIRTDNTPSAYGASWAPGDRMGVEFDADAGTLNFFKNGVDQGVAFTGLNDSEGYVTHCRSYFSTGTYYFHEADWTYTPTTDFKALTANNMPSRSPTTPSSPQIGSVLCTGTTDNAMITLNMVPDEAGPSTVNGITLVWGVGGNAIACGTGVKLISAVFAAGTFAYSIAVKAYTGGSNVVPATAQ